MSKKRSNRRGAALVEFSLVLPVIVIFFCGLVEISRVLLIQHTADTAAYEGARAGMVPGATAQEIEDVAKELLTASGLHSSTITVTPSVITEDTALVSVHVDIPVAENAWITPSRFTNISVSSEVTLYCERPPIVRLTGVPAMKLKKSKGKKTIPGT